jgi:hypothetical protein
MWPASATYGNGRDRRRERGGGGGAFISIHQQRQQESPCARARVRNQKIYARAMCARACVCVCVCLLTCVCAATPRAAHATAPTHQEIRRGANTELFANKQCQSQDELRIRVRNAHTQLHELYHQRRRVRVIKRRLRKQRRRGTQQQPLRRQHIVDTHRHTHTERDSQPNNM